MNKSIAYVGNDWSFGWRCHFLQIMLVVIVHCTSCISKDGAPDSSRCRTPLEVATEKHVFTGFVIRAAFLFFAGCTGHTSAVCGELLFEE